MRDLLERTLAPTELTIHDDSHLHVGHPGAKDGKGHFSVHITSPYFTGSSRIKRHRMVFDSLGDMMETDIHALHIVASTPGEHDDKEGRHLNLSRQS